MNFKLYKCDNSLWKEENGKWSFRTSDEMFWFPWVKPLASFDDMVEVTDPAEVFELLL